MACALFDGGLLWFGTLVCETGFCAGAVNPVTGSQESCTCLLHADTSALNQHVHSATVAFLFCRVCCISSTAVAQMQHLRTSLGTTSPSCTLLCLTVYVSMPQGGVLRPQPGCCFGHPWGILVVIDTP